MKIPCVFLEKPSPQVDSDTETDAVTETDAADAEDADSEGETETEAVDSPESEDAKVDPAEKADAENEKDVALIQEILGHVWRIRNSTCFLYGGTTGMGCDFENGG